MGDAHTWALAQHQKYGPVVRLSPNLLSYTESRAWKEIYGFGKSHAPPIPKDPDSYTPPPNGVPGLLAALNDEYHAKTRRIFTPAFSERALREQESIFLGYVHVLVEKLKGESKAGIPIDMVRWLNFTTFDVRQLAHHAVNLSAHQRNRLWAT